MVHVAGEAGAVNRPLVLIVPQDAAQLTDIFAENCWVLPTVVVAPAGVMVIGEVMFTVVDAVPLPSVALPVTLHAGCDSGAVNNPPDEIVPHVALQVEALLAVNCFVVPSLTVGFCGEMVYVD